MMLRFHSVESLLIILTEQKIKMKNQRTQKEVKYIVYNINKIK
jgi:hypothetical protein